jgi:hypothetical protein
MNPDGGWTLVYESVYILNTIEPRWASMRIELAALCNGDLDRALKIEIFDRESSGKHQFMGEVLTTVRQLLAFKDRPMVVIEKDRRDSEKGYINSGHFFARDVLVEQHSVFPDVRQCITEFTFH